MKEVALLSSFRTLVATALTLLAALAAAPAALAQDTPVGGLQQLPAPNDCISTQAGAPAECGTVIDGGTTGARSIAITPDGENAYVASSRGDNTGSLATFTRNASTGELSFNACVRDPSSNEACAGEVTQLNGATYVVATDAFVYVASRVSDSVRAFARNQTTGALTPVAAATGCINETGAGGCREGDGLNGVEYLELSPDGEFLYAISSEQGTIAILELDPATGEIDQDEDNFVSESGVRAADISEDGAHLYAVSPTTDRLIKYDRNTTTGLLTRDQCFRDPSQVVPDANCATTAEGLDGAHDVVVVTTGDASNVYVVAREQSLGAQGSTLARFTRATGTGDLSAVSCVRDDESSDTGCTTEVVGIRDATSISARPDGEFLYVTGTGDDAIAYFERNTETGAVSQQGGANEKCVSDGDAECSTEDDDANGLTDVNETAVSPDGRFLYSTAPTDDAVAEFAIQYAPTCPDVTRDDVPAQTTVDITPACADLNQPRDVLTVEAVSQPAAGQGTVTAVDTNNDGRADTLRYNPGNFIGTTTFTYRAVDDQGNASDPATVTVTVLASGAPVISVSDAGGSEGESIAFTFQRSGPTTERITVFYSTQNDTATSPDDFPGQTNQSVVFEAGETSKTVNILANDDNIDEETERFRLVITNVVEDAGPTPAVSDALGIGTIADNDTSIVSIGDDTVAEDGGPAQLTVTLSNPSSRTVTVNYTTGEGTATDPEDFTAPQSGSTVSFAPGQTTATISIPIVDDNAVEQSEQFTVTLSAPTGAAQLGDASGSVTITDDEQPSLSISDASVVEGDSATRNATFTVTLSAQTSSTVTVNYATSSGTATAGSDYTTTSGTLTFTPGSTTRTIDVPVAGDVADEADETFTVTLSTPANATLADGTGQGTITDDDQDPSVSVGDTSVAEGDDGTRNAVFTISLSNAPESTVTVDYATSNGTATAGSDYDAASGTVTFAVGETSKTVNVPVRGDTAVEDDETFTVTLSDPTNATIGDGTGAGRINNDDRQPAEQPQPPAPRTTVVVGDTGISEGDGGDRAVTFTVALSQPAPAPVSVDVATVQGTATEGSDFRGGGGRITFAAGQTTQAVPVDIIGDSIPEGDEQFTLVLRNATGADIAKATGTATIANDDIVRKRPGLTFRVTPARDLTLPHVFRVTGRVVLPSGVSAAEGCGTGTVSVQYKNGGNTISTRRATVDPQCRFTVRTPFNIRSRLRNARTLKLTVRFLGNRYLSPRTAQPVSVRVRR